jgi:hypothetical protein
MIAGSFAIGLIVRVACNVALRSNGASIRKHFRLEKRTPETDFSAILLMSACGQAAKERGHPNMLDKTTDSSTMRSLRDR